jgi:hypothetical protein
VPEDHLALEQEVRRRDRVEVAAPQDRDEVGGDEEEAQRQQHLIEVAAVADRHQRCGEHEPECDSEHDRDRGRGDERQPLLLHELVPEVGAQQVEAPVREVEHVEHAEDQREPDCQDEDQHPERDAVEDAREVLVEEVRR